MSCEDSASLLLVDDNATFCRVLRTALIKRGFSVTVAHSVEEALPLAFANPPEFSIVDMKMDGAPGLVLVKALHELDPNTRIVVLTGYASIHTAVEAIKLGATQYLAKPANADDYVNRFGADILWGAARLAEGPSATLDLYAGFGLFYGIQAQRDSAMGVVLLLVMTGFLGLLLEFRIFTSHNSTSSAIGMKRICSA